MQTSSLSQQQSPARVHLVSHQQSVSDPPPHLPVQLPEDMHPVGRVAVGDIVSFRSFDTMSSSDGSVEDTDATTVTEDTDELLSSILKLVDGN